MSDHSPGAPQHSPSNAATPPRTRATATAIPVLHPAAAAAAAVSRAAGPAPGAREVGTTAARTSAHGPAGAQGLVAAALESASATRLPPASQTMTAGWVPNGLPTTTAAGRRSRANRAAGPRTTMKASETAETRPKLVCVGTRLCVLVRVRAGVQKCVCACDCARARARARPLKQDGIRRSSSVDLQPVEHHHPP
jgi:hypothetical protein